MSRENWFSFHWIFYIVPLLHFSYYFSYLIIPSGLSLVPIAHIAMAGCSWPVSYFFLNDSLSLILLENVRCKPTHCFSLYGISSLIASSCTLLVDSIYGNASLLAAVRTVCKPTNYFFPYLVKSSLTALIACKASSAILEAIFPYIVCSATCSPLQMFLLSNCSHWLYLAVCLFCPLSLFACITFCIGIFGLLWLSAHTMDSLLLWFPSGIVIQLMK